MDLPAVNALLNGTAAVLLCLGYAAIRAGRKDLHRNLMLGACGVSAAFLACYMVHHLRVGHVEYRGEGAMKWVYYAVLSSHILAVAVVTPLVIMTLRRAFRGELERHKRLARWTLPLWLYVSVTGVIVYWMLYRGPGRG